MHIAPIWTQIHDWITNNLPGAMVCDIATAAGLVHLDATRGEQLRRRNQMRPRDRSLRTKRDDVRVFEEKKEIRNSVGAPVLDERALHLSCRRVRDDAKPPDF